MQTEQEYQIVLSDENIPIIIIRHKNGKPEKPLILYNGGKHALLYRQPDEVIALDYLHPEVRPHLMKAPFAIIMEKTPDEKSIENDYKAPIKIMNTLKK